MQLSLIIVIVVAPPKFVKTHYYIFKGCKYNWVAKSIKERGQASHKLTQKNPS